MEVQPERILETILYAEDLAAMETFYGEVLGLPLISVRDDRHRFFRCGNSMLLVFNPQITREAEVSVRGQLIPKHGAAGPGHVAFAVSEKELPQWREQLAATNVPIEQEVEWPGGGHSIYFRDPADNSVELATPNLWFVES